LDNTLETKGIDVTFLNRKLLVAVAALFMLIGLAACSDDDNSSPSPPAAATPPPDADGDGVADDDDAFPDDPNESVDSDGDGVGDNGDNCPETENAGQEDSDANGSGDACDAMPVVYSAAGNLNGGSNSGVSYSGQTARLVLQQKLTDYMEDLVEQEGELDTVSAGLRFYVTGDGIDEVNHDFTTKGGDPVTPGPTYADISSGKNLNGKIAGGNQSGGGETGKLINDEFFGWDSGLDSTPLPIELVYAWMDALAAEATDGQDPTITIADGSEVNIASPMISREGVHYRQLIQKFLSVAVNFSQGANDYLQTDFGSEGSLTPYKDKTYSTGAHKFDEGFGYYGASRDLNDYTDDEAAGKGGRAEYGNGYYDSNGDGLVDLKSELVFGHAQNCAKRDRKKNAEGVAYTDFSKDAMDAFMIGRRIVENAEVAGELTDAADEALQAQIKIAATTWEKCIAATVVHYINDVSADIADFSNGAFADRGNFVNLSKHWGEMKGFALGLQFSPLSPFRDGSTGKSVTDLKRALELMGDAPMLPDGSQNGQATNAASAADAIAKYLSDLLEARTIFAEAYDFDSEVVPIW
jgi:hypothetical protein